MLVERLGMHVMVLPLILSQCPSNCHSHHHHSNKQDDSEQQACQAAPRQVRPCQQGQAEHPTAQQGRQPSKSTMPDHTAGHLKAVAKAQEKVAAKASKAVQGLAATLAQHVQLLSGTDRERELVYKFLAFKKNQLKWWATLALLCLPLMLPPRQRQKGMSQQLVESLRLDTCTGVTPAGSGLLPCSDQRGHFPAHYHLHKPHRHVSAKSHGSQLGLHKHVSFETLVSGCYRLCRGKGVRLAHGQPFAFLPACVPLPQTSLTAFPMCPFAGA